MNVRLLKKIRKRYHWYWKSEPGCQLVILDLRKKEVSHYWTPRNFIINYLYEHHGFWTGAKYRERKAKVDRYNNFRRELKKIIKP